MNRLHFAKQSLPCFAWICGLRIFAPPVSSGSNRFSSLHQRGPDEMSGGTISRGNGFALIFLVRKSVSFFAFRRKIQSRSCGLKVCVLKNSLSSDVKHFANLHDAFFHIPFKSIITGHDKVAEPENYPINLVFFQQSIIASISTFHSVKSRSKLLPTAKATLCVPGFFRLLLRVSGLPGC